MGSFRSSTRVEARTGLAVSANRVTAIYAAYSWPTRSLVSIARRAGCRAVGADNERTERAVATFMREVVEPERAWFVRERNAAAADGRYGGDQGE
jgi:hypothetical protein